MAQVFETGRKKNPFLEHISLAKLIDFLIAARDRVTAAPK